MSGGAGAAAIPAAIVLAVDTLTAAAALSVAIGTTAVSVGEIGENVCYSKGGTKGKSFRAGSKSTRDKWYGHNEQEFHKWYERSGKQFYNNGMDIESKAECDELYEIWKELGCPYPK